MSKFKVVRVKPLVRWQFYYELDGKEHHFSFRECKVPTRTKDWDLLKRIKNTSLYGYRIKEKL